MLIDCITRFIRRKLVLGIIFILSLTYCLYSFAKDWEYPDATFGSSKSDVFPTPEKMKQFVWNSDQDQSIKNDSLSVTSCRNSVQGKYLMADDRGYLCKRIDVQANGCCNLTSSFTTRYSCDTCNTEGCCSVYENCISCCLNPNKKSLLEDVFHKANGGLRVILSSISDHFELCLAKCRTNSLSVYHENSYKNPLKKYCYAATPSNTVTKSS